METTAERGPAWLGLWELWMRFLKLSCIPSVREQLPGGKIVHKEYRMEKR